MDPSLILGGVKLLGGLFGRKSNPTPASNLLSQAQGAREAADKYGFNPLTMLQYGQTGGAMGGSAPLASAELLSSGLSDITDVVTGEKARRDASNRLELELGKLKLEQLRAGGIQVQPSAVGSVGIGVSPLGRRAATVGYGNAVSVASSPVSSGSVRPSGVDRAPNGDGVWVAGTYVPATPGYDDAQTVENQYSDVGSNIFGVARMMADGIGMAMNYRPPYVQRQGTVIGRARADGTLLTKRQVDALPVDTDSYRDFYPVAPPSSRGNPWKRLKWPSGAPTFSQF